MKKITTKLSILALMILFFACSKEKDPAPDNTTPLKPGISENEVLIEAPANLQSSEDPMAQQVAGYIELANAISTSFSYFEVPQGATVSDTPIIPINGRISGSAKYHVYTWLDVQSETSFTYQVEEFDGFNTFEVFWKLKGETDWTRLYLAEENKEKTVGKFIVYDFSGSDKSKEALSYNWTKSADLFNLIMKIDTLSYNFEINRKTGAGKSKYINNGSLIYLINWDATGNGTWTYYDENGAEVNSGSWTA